MREKWRICLDPGHPSYFRGTKRINWGCSYEDIREVEINLQLAKRLKQLLENQGFRAKLTRTNNTQIVSNKKRAEIARDFQADLFLRIHVDWERHNDPEIRGVKTIYPPPAAKNIYLRSWRIALIVQQNIVLKTLLVDRGAVDERITSLKDEQGMLEGTYWANKFGIPTILLELGYLSSPGDRKWVTQKENQHLLTAAIAEGVNQAWSVLKRAKGDINFTIVSD